MSRLVFTSFASSDMKKSLIRIGKQARSFGMFDEIRLFTERNLPRYAKKRCKAVIKMTGTRRGYAYWCWKPVIINLLLSKMDEGDVLIYSDAGTHMNPNGKEKLLEYIEEAKKNDIWAVRLEDHLPDIDWTKADTIEYFRSRILDDAKRAEFDSAIHEAQVEGGTIIAVKNGYTMRLMREWERIMSLENLHLFDDSPSVLENSPSFRENRHDQSTLSLLLKSNHYSATHTEHFYSSDEYPGGVEYTCQTRTVSASQGQGIRSAACSCPFGISQGKERARKGEAEDSGEPAA